MKSITCFVLSRRKTSEEKCGIRGVIELIVWEKESSNWLSLGRWLLEIYNKYKHNYITSVVKGKLFSIALEYCITLGIIREKEL